MSSPTLRLLTPQGPHPRGYRFGPFELEIRSGELKKHGVRIRLRQQSVQILVLLLERSGEVVLREEIRQKLWRDDTVVEFDKSINTAIQRLRDILQDSAEEPRYIETLARRGYRFIGTVEVSDPQPVRAAVEIPPASPRTAIRKAVHPSRRLLMLELAIAAALCVVAVVGWLRPVSPVPARQWVLPLGNMGDAVLSPDGGAILYGDSPGLFLRRMDSNATTELYSAARLIDHPAWSPDGAQALFHTRTGLIRLPVPHGPPVTIWPGTRITRGYSWGPEGEILVAVHEFNGVGSLFLVSPDNPSPRRLDIPQLKEGIFYEPEFLPEGGKFLFTWDRKGDEDAGVYLGTLKHDRVVSAPLLLKRNITAAHFASAGGDRLLYVENNSLYAQALDVARGALSGEPRRIVEDVFSILEMRHAFFAVSRSGALAWRPGKAGMTQLTWFDRGGRVVGTAGPAGEPSAVVLSPDENHLLLTLGDHFAGLLDPLQNSYIRLPGLVRGVWTPDNAHILHRPPGGGRVLERDLVRGTDREVAQVPNLSAVRALSPDGKVLLYAVGEGIYSIRLDGAPGSPQPVVASSDHCRYIGFSPDGRFIVYAAYVPAVNRVEVFVKPLAFAGLARQISVDGGAAPVWRGDGREILYNNGSKIFGVRVSVRQNQLSASPPSPLFDVRVPAGLAADSAPLAVTRDGSRILFTQAGEGADSKMTYIMTGWDRALTQ